MADKCPKCGAEAVPGTITGTSWVCESVISLLDGQFAQSWACERLAARAAEIAALHTKIDSLIEQHSANEEHQEKQIAALEARLEAVRAALHVRGVGPCERMSAVRKALEVKPC